MSIVIFAAAGSAATKPYVVIVTGDHEYSGEQTLPVLARELERQYGFRCTVLRASPDQNAEENIPGLEVLAQADVAIFYLRWRRLPKEQLAHIDAYVRSGKPLLGFRTSSHSFNYPKGDDRERWPPDPPAPLRPLARGRAPASRSPLPARNLSASLP